MRTRRVAATLAAFALMGAAPRVRSANLGDALPGTQPLTLTGDVASVLVAGVDRFLLNELERTAMQRERRWHWDASSAQAYRASVATNRAELARILGVRDSRPATNMFQPAGLVLTSGLVARRTTHDIYAVRWPAFGDVCGEGLLLCPSPDLSKPAAVAPAPRVLPPFAPKAWIVAVPDADQTPEQLAGLQPGLTLQSQVARYFAEQRCVVVCPALVSRKPGRPKSGDGRGRNLGNREFLYRSAFELGRHPAGYEVQKILAAVDCLYALAHATGDLSRPTNAGDALSPTATPLPLGVFGWGEGGRLALCAGALDERITVTCVSGAFGPRDALWQEPADRNFFGILERFGDAEIASLIAPRALWIEAARGPEHVVPPDTGAAPGRLTTPPLDGVRAEYNRARRFTQALQPTPRCELVVSGDGSGPFGSEAVLSGFMSSLAPGALRNLPGDLDRATLTDAADAAREERQVRELDRHNQALLDAGAAIRQQWFARLDTGSPDQFERSATPYRERFYRDIIGRFDRAPLPPNPRTRLAYDLPAADGYEVVLDVFPDVIAYGVLLVPKNLQPNERRPVVVCQHGLEGRPQDLIQGDTPAYHDFAARLAARGFVTFAPQNLYLFGDRFRSLQRKANPIGKTLFSIIVPQHQQITDWLKSLTFVDGTRIGFYGLSYGGKTAMRVPPLVANYCLAICSGDFNDWVWKNASTRSPYSYVWTGEYEIFEFDLGNTFNYAEMAALIAPRPFMVERGHLDGVAPDETVAFEFAKVRHLYAARLGVGDRCEIEWFVGPHTINGQGTFRFLHRHLNWPAP